MKNVGGPSIQKVYKISYIASKREKNKKIMITNHQRRDKSSCQKIQGVEK